MIMGTIALFTIQSIKADDDCGMVTIGAIDSLYSNNVGDTFQISINDSKGILSTDSYSYTTYMKDITSGSIETLESDTFKGATASSIKFTTGGKKSIYIVYKKIGIAVCEKTSNSLELDITTNKTDSPNISLTVSSAKGEVGSNFSMQVKILNGVDGIVKLYIDDWEKSLKEMNPMDFEYVWDTMANSSTVGTHRIKAKVYNMEPDASGTNQMTDFKEAFITLCPTAELSDSACPVTISTATTPGSEVVVPVDVPDTSEVTIGGQTININLNRGSGIGGLIKFIINLLVSLVGAFAFISFMVAGIQYITASGDATKAEKAKKTMIYAGVAIVLATFSLVIIHVVNNLITS